ncbi:SusD/RagB family nutrient-binding outer membrane lipoprotein [Parasediminibacterium paludis]|uniref:SusD/RagB family nutrient-binding outer membrane lipoprotein n=1 Tax=Parasediminibacterium paludis TaxID=908966 RepID=A0ABV8PT97_9BACT
MKLISLKNSLAVIAIAIAVITTSCQKGDLLSNPNAVSATSSVPPALLLNHITYSLYAGGGVTDGRSGAVNEIPWDLPFIWSQYHVSNYQYYRGNNFYNWSATATNYDMLRYASLMEQQAISQFGSTPNPYPALAKFFKAYSFIWLTQRVGDIPMTQAGDPNNLTPTYNTQHDVYKNSLALLDTANTLLGKLVSLGYNSVVGGDIYNFTTLQWQQVVNAYKLRVLISLSKRAVDNADLNIPGQFATIINNPSQYPLFGSNSDNLVFKFNTAYNGYPIWTRGNGPYNNYSNICKTFLDTLTAYHDPRTFIAATPAPAQITAGKSISDFTAYVGADINTPIATLFSNGSTLATSIYSYANYKRYYAGSPAGAVANAEPYIIIGYPEMCFNIAEAINRGWVSGTAATWYTNGIKASLGVYGLTQGQTYTVGDGTGKTLGTVTIDINTFLNNVAYAGDNAVGLNQILTQKYVAFFQNSGWEAFYNWRRTGVPTFAQGGVGIGTPTGLIPRRWQYPTDELNYNTTNCKAAITSQFGGVDDLTKDTWLTK